MPNQKVTIHALIYVDNLPVQSSMWLIGTLGCVVVYREVILSICLTNTSYIYIYYCIWP